MEAKSGIQLAIAWTPFVVVIAAWFATLVYVRMSPTAVKHWLEGMARKLPDRDRR